MVKGECFLYASLFLVELCGFSKKKKELISFLVCLKFFSTFVPIRVEACCFAVNLSATKFLITALDVKRVKFTDQWSSG